MAANRSVRGAHRDRTEIWRQHFSPKMPLGPDVDTDKLAREFELTGGLIKNAVLAAVLRAVSRNAPAVTMGDLTHGARLQLRIGEDETGSLLRPEVRLDDIVLSANARERIDQFISAARVRGTMLAEWGFGRTLGRGLTLAALLAGPSAGKSMTAEAIAYALDRPLLRAKVSGLLSKYVGQTAKRIDAIFQRARAHRAVLVFDEADALFARRVAVRSSTDRYANAETGALLGAIDTYDGLVILTSNLAPEIDPAFGRRFHMRIDYERPDVAARASIWRRLLPTEAPLAADVDTSLLARAYDLTGGEIRNGILAAALEAASAPAGARCISHAMLDRAARAQLFSTAAEATSAPAHPNGPIGLA